MAHSQTAPAVAYISKYGSTARYAHILADRLDCTPVDLESEPTPRASGPLVVLAPIYIGRIRSATAVTKALNASAGPVALAVVGMSPVDDPGRDDLTAPIRRDSQSPLQVFQLRGNYDPKGLGLFHRIAMALLRFQLRRHPDEPGAADILSGRRLEFLDPAAVEPIVDWATGAR